MFAEPEWDFGTIQQGESVEHAYIFTNEGTAPLTVTEAKSSCGCTVPTFTRDPVPPKGRGEIHVRFNSHGRRGHQSKTVTIRSNDPQKPMLMLRLTVDIETPPAGEIQYRPSRLDFGLVRAGEFLEREVTIRNVGKHDLVIQGLYGSPPHLDGFMEGPLTLPPGASGTVVVVMRPSDRTPGGYFERTVTIRSNDPVRPSSRIPCVAYMTAHREGRLLTIGGQVDVGVIQEPNAPLLSLPLLNPGDSLVSIERVQAVGAALSVPFAQGTVLEAGETMQLDVKSSARLHRGTFRDRILIYSTASQNLRAPSHTINVIGYVAVDTWQEAGVKDGPPTPVEPEPREEKEGGGSDAAPAPEESGEAVPGDDR